MLGLVVVAAVLAGGAFAVRAMTGSVGTASSSGGPVEAGVVVHRVDGLPEDFLAGVDVSTVLSLEASGVTFRDARGEPSDLFEVLAGSGVNSVRVRVWVDPFDEAGRGFGGGNVDAVRATQIGRRATAAGMSVLVDFHYSDFWADPAKQQVPRSWADLDAAGRAEEAAAHTRETLELMADAGVDVAMVQVGNETTSGVAGLDAWGEVCAVFSAGAAAVREVYPEALVAVHFTNPEREGEYERFAKILDNFDVDYDVFASSYYPFWHGTLENLTAVLSHVRETHGKQVAVVETSWAYTLADGDGSGNVVGDAQLASAYPVSVQGQATAVRDVVQAVVDAGGIGVYYWEPAWLPVGPPSELEANQALWERDGSGWASSFAGTYDPDDAGQFYGGSAWDNQALFDFEGNPLGSLRVFEYVRTGATAPLAVERVFAPSVDVHVGEPLVLPEVVTVEHNDGTRVEASVVWASAPDTQTEGTFTVAGTVEGAPDVLASITVRARNDLANGGFEDDDLSMWDLDSEASTFRVVADNPEAAQGERVVNFWHDARYAISLTQTVRDLEPGTYTVRASVHGEGADGDGEQLALVARAATAEVRAPLSLDGWLAWHTGTLEVEVGGDGELTVGVVGNLGAGDWGFIDDVVVTPKD
ncbi:MAG: arabinogalactan endo-1,4-beta-galactosidase [Actinomycetales bacterium]|nr:arabinogalactan endo-1,4-beta-galactosidase [Actinomycetales bacterium]